MSHNAATARVGRSCRRRACSPRRRSPPIAISTRPWLATSAAAVPTSGFARGSRPGQGEREMAAILENVSRRSILIGGAAVAGGLVIGLRFLPRGFASSPSAAPVDVPRFNPTAFVSIDETGLVTIVAHRSEMGQGIRTALPMAVADELEADWSRVRIVQAVGDEVTYGGQTTDGSRSLRHFLRPMREMGAAARQMLETAAANAWGVDVSEVRARNHQVMHIPTRRVVDYGAVALAARELPVPQPDALKLKRPSEFRYIGQGLPIVHLADKTSGRAGYGIDRRFAGVKDAGIAAPPVIKADYYVPHLAHARMEPPAAAAHVADGRCDVWACTQNPQGARDELVKALGIPADRVKVNVTLLGGGFGRKSKPDYVVEAALLSRAVRAPVKVTWTREDEIQHDYYHTVNAQHLEAALDARGRAIAWLHRAVFPAIPSTFQPNVTYASDGELSQGVLDVPYAIRNIRCENGEAEPHVRIGWVRSLLNTPHAFAVCSFAYELAHAAGRGPKDHLLELLGPPRSGDT